MRSFEDAAPTESIRDAQDAEATDGLPYLTDTEILSVLKLIARRRRIVEKELQRDPKDPSEVIAVPELDEGDVANA